MQPAAKMTMIKGRKFPPALIRISRFSLAFVLFFLNKYSFEQAFCQQQDFQIWQTAKISAELTKDFRFMVEEELRFRENASMMDRQINDLGISYRVNKYLRTALFFRLEADWKNADLYLWRQGLYGDFTFRIEPSRFTLSYRARIQSTKTEIYKEEAVLAGGFKHRHKISAEYNIKGLPIAPFAEGELFVACYTGKGSEIAGVRAWAGMNYAPGKRHNLYFKYGIDRELNTADPLHAYAMVIGYEYSMKK
jgi:hypothetical protein